MKFTSTKFRDLVIIEPDIFYDKRGYFLESYNLKKIQKEISKIEFIQDNESKSSKGVLRGLHFQKPPYDQSKLVRCIIGRVLDVVVDIRIGSPTYGKYFSIELTGENKKQLFIPKGFAHGFSVLSDDAIFAYKVDNIYAPKYDSGIIWNDKNLNIDWGLNKNKLKISKKDNNLNSFDKIDSPFYFKK